MASKADCVRAANGVEIAEHVDDSEMRGRIEQRVMFVLAVELDEARREIAQRGRRRERAVDERAAATLRRDFAAHEHVLAAALEDGLDRGRVLPRPHEVAGRAAAQEQADRVDEHGLARAGLAGRAR